MVIDFQIDRYKQHNKYHMEPGGKIIGCRFHPTQAWWRKIQEIGLADDYKRRKEVGKWLGYCFRHVILDKN